MDGPKRAKPAAEKPAYDNGENNGCNAPYQSGIEGTGGDECPDTDQGIKLEKPVDRPPSELPPFVAKGCGYTEPEKQNQEKEL
jgi:hypothetical protein